ncbi:hypothetical protein CP532_6823 [Ophiocordyceps camponoti-leonardi (nom. inval.)]|nr:hypothetical protein CP532_6823 [Ophiocordyceps camponoti-leonardi (nom. inval.)]
MYDIDRSRYRMSSVEEQEPDCVRMVALMHVPGIFDDLEALAGSERLLYESERQKRGSTFCKHLVNLLERASRHRTPACDAIDRLEVEYATDAKQEPNKDGVSFEFRDRWAYDLPPRRTFSPSSSSSPRRGVVVVGGAMPGRSLRLSVDMLSSFGKGVVKLVEVNAVTIRSYASFSGRKRRSRPWKVNELRIHARCVDTGKHIVVNKWKDISRVLYHPDRYRRYSGQESRIWEGTIELTDWDEVQPGEGNRSI